MVNLVSDSWLNIPFCFIYPNYAFLLKLWRVFEKVILEIVLVDYLGITKIKSTCIFSLKSVNEVSLTHVNNSTLANSSACGRN